MRLGDITINIVCVGLIYYACQCKYVNINIIKYKVIYDYDSDNL